MTPTIYNSYRHIYLRVSLKMNKAPKTMYNHCLYSIETTLHITMVAEPLSLEGLQLHQ